MIDDSQFAAANEIPSGCFSVIQDTPFSLALAFDLLLTGDFDQDDDVDGNDLTDPVLGWTTRFGDDLDGSDFLTWQRNLGNPSSVVATSSSSGPVSEPASMCLGLCALLFWNGVSSKRGRRPGHVRRVNHHHGA